MFWLRYFFTLLLCLFVSPVLGLAQGSSEQGVAGYYVYLGEERELQINVQIWGHVLKPGMYLVPNTTDLVGLISFAGGPTENADLGKVKVIRRRSSEVDAFTVDLKKFTRGENPQEIPQLEPGDTVLVPATFFHSLRRAVSFLAQAAIIAGVYYQIFGGD